MREWLRSSDGPVVALAAGVLVVAAAGFHVSNVSTFIAFAILVAISELFEVTLPNDAPYTLGLAPALGFALQGVLRFGATASAGTRPSEGETIAVLAIGLFVAGIARMLARKRFDLPGMATHILTLAAVTTIAAQVATLRAWPEDGLQWVAGCGAMIAAVLLVPTLVQTARTVARERIPFMPVFTGSVRSTGALHLSVLSVGGLLAIAYPSLGYWSFPLFLAPLAATQFAFRQFASIRTTYLQTIRALSKVPEMAGYTEKGHSTRVADLSVAIARELGAADQDTAEIEYAALLHDIGRVSIPDPEMVAEFAGKAELAIVGAGIVRETGHFPRVAEMIEQQHEPYRRRGEEANNGVPLGAKIIKVASAYDDFTKPGGVGLSPWDALERLHAGMAFEYDPQVIQALTRTLDKRGGI